MQILLITTVVHVIKEADSGLKSPFSPVQAGIAGWDDGVKGACPGEIRRVTVPPSKGYGEKGVEGSVPPNTTIVLEMEILKIEDRVVSFLDQISSGNFRG